MNLTLLGLLVGAALPTRAAIIEAVPHFDAAPTAAMAGALPTLAAPALFAVPSLFAAPSLFTAPSLFAAPAFSAPSLSAAPAAAPALSAPLAAALAPATAAAPAAAAALTPAFSAAAHAGTQLPSTEKAALEAAVLFDGVGAARPSDATPVSQEPGSGGHASAEAGWTRGTFTSADGLSVTFKRRAGPAGKAPRVYFGGLALNESFDPLFNRTSSPARPEYFAWTRGHAPTGWTPTGSVLDADARDLAKMIVVASQETGSPTVDLALHSFAAGVFQRMTQLRGEPEVRRALNLLSGAHVEMMNGMTHYDDVEKLGGPAVEQMAQGTKMLVGWLESWDALAKQMESMRSNPFTAMQAQMWLDGYRYQRDQLLSMATKPAVDAMRHDLAAPWDDAAADPVRRGFQKALDKNAHDAGWQEALLRRSHDSFVLDFKTADARFLRRLGVRIDFVHAVHDQLLNWQAAQLLFERFGIKTPAAMPPAGTVLTDSSGLFKATLVDADHYYPLKRSDDLARRLDP